MSETEIPMSVPLDPDGFLRRECPTCEREFKWRRTPEGEESEAAPDAGYFCPYCAVQAPLDAWWTKDQLDAVKSKIYNEVIGPKLDEFGRLLGSASGSFVQVKATRTEREEPPPLSESDDMRRVHFACHPSEPVKVLDDWERDVHCLLCGQPTAVT